MRSRIIGGIVALLLNLAVQAAPPTTCRDSDAYARALCAYQHRHFAEAAQGFEAVSTDSSNPKAIPALYFLARCEMKQGRFKEAESRFYRIYEAAPEFYREWDCDFLLGECRRAEGKS